MLFPTTPFEAYRNDLARIPREEQFGPTDSAWLLIATVVRRLSQMDLDERAEYATSFAREAESMNYFAEGSPPETLALMQRICPPFLSIAEEGGIDKAVEALRDVADDMDTRGALSLSLSFCAALHEAFPDAGPYEQGMVLMRRARASRQLGDFDTATELYGMAIEVGERWELPELEVRADLGLAAITHVKGNYPEARRQYEKVLSGATQYKIDEMIEAANHGLMGVADAAGDFDAALQYGWAAFTDRDASDERRTEMLINLAEICERAGYYEAALHGSREALARAVSARHRLAALGLSARTAARMSDKDALAQSLSQSDRELKACTLPFERARLFKNLAEAHFLSGDFSSGEKRRKEALSLARRYGFNEIVVRTEELPRQLMRLTRDAYSLNEPATQIVDSLQKMGGAA